LIFKGKLNFRESKRNTVRVFKVGIGDSSNYINTWNFTYWISIFWILDSLKTINIIWLMPIHFSRVFYMGIRSKLSIIMLFKFTVNWILIYICLTKIRSKEHVVYLSRFWFSFVSLSFSKYQLYSLGKLEIWKSQKFTESFFINFSENWSQINFKNIASNFNI